MRILSRKLAVTLVAFSVIAPAAGAQVIDQQQTNNEGYFGYLSSWNLQSFKPTGNNVAGGGFNLFTQYYSGGSATIALFSGTPGSGLTMLASGTGVVLGGQYAEWVDAFWSPVSVTSGGNYALGIYSSTTNAITREGYGDPYANGQAYYTYSANYNAAPGCCGTYHDLTFREYSSANVAPEPASVAPLATGLVGVVGIARRRRSL